MTYTQADETGASLKAANWRKVKELAPRGSWAEDSPNYKKKRDPIGNGGVARILWELTVVSGSPKRPDKVCIESTPRGDGTDHFKEKFLETDDSSQESGQ